MFVAIFISLQMLLIAASESYDCRFIPYFCECEAGQFGLNLGWCSITNFNKLHIISNRSYTPHVSILNVYFQYIDCLPPSTFRGFIGLTTLNIMGDDLKCIERHAFRDLKETLLHLRISGTSLQARPNDDINDLKNLISLGFDGNLITSIGHLENLYLYYLDVGGNRLSTIESHTLPQTLQFLDLSSNDLLSLNGSLRNLGKLEILNISNNIIRFLTGELEDTQELTQLYAQKNVIIILENRPFHRVLLLTKLNLAFNRIYEITDALKELKHLKELDISYNDLTKLHETAFSDLISLETLYLDHNNLSSLENGFFDCLTSLKVLDISYNKFIRLNFLRAPSRVRPLSTEVSNCNFKDYETLLSLNIKDSGVVCNNAFSRLLQYLLWKNIDVSGNPCDYPAYDY